MSKNKKMTNEEINYFMDSLEYQNNATKTDNEDPEPPTKPPTRQ